MNKIQLGWIMIFFGTGIMVLLFVFESRLKGFLLYFWGALATILLVIGTLVMGISEYARKKRELMGDE